jgi:hypothetical protein
MNQKNEEINMSAKTLSIWVRLAAIASAVCGLTLCVWVLPAWGMDSLRTFPAFYEHFWPWLLFLWVAALPCFGILILVWKVADSIVRDTVFSRVTAKRISLAAGILLGDIAFFFVGNVVLMLLHMSHPGILLFSILVDMLGVSLAIFAAVLSRYITKAALLQEDAEGTI